MNSDEELVKELNKGSHKAFAEIIKKYQNPVIGLAYRFIGDYDVAVDVAQETFARLYLRSKTLLSTTNIANYLLVIAANLSRDEIRRRKKYEPWPDDDGGNEDEYVKALCVAPDEYMPDARIDQTELAQRIQRALMKLPPPIREAVILRDINEYTYEDIVEISGVNPGTVRSRISRGRKLMRRLLADAYNEIHT